jgi:beta-galactosidase
MDILHQAGLRIVLGTPTATPPKWLVDKIPDMLALDRNGQSRGFGSRRHYCFSSESYRGECHRIVTRLAQEFGAHPGLAAWQTDNEYGCHDTVESYSLAALHAFRAWLSRKYGTIEALNSAWGNVFWSMEYGDFSEIELPHLTVTEANPSHRLDFQRFSSDQVIAFNRLQTDILRTYSPGRPILHNFMGYFTAFDHYALARDLDAAAWDSYPLGFLDRDGRDPERQARYLRVGDPDAQAFHHDLYRACGKGRWWVMEQQPGPVNWAFHNPAPAAGATRLWAYEAFAAGAETVSYFRWRQAPFSQEQMHEALLLPNNDPSECWHTVHRLAGELKELEAEVRPSRSDIALVFDYESQWAWEIQPQGKEFSYLHLVLDYYRALRGAGCSIDIVPPEPAALAHRKLIVLPGLFTARADFVAALANSDAAILIGPRSGAKTPDFHIPANLPPGQLQQLIDIKIRRVESLPPGIRLPLAGSNRASLGLWREFAALGPSVETLERTQDGEPALLRQEKVFYATGWGNEEALASFTRRALGEAGLHPLNLPRDIRLRDHGNLRYIFNYGPEAVDIGTLIAGACVKLGGTPLPPCEVCVIARES